MESRIQVFFTRQEQRGLWRLDLSSRKVSSVVPELANSDLNNWVANNDAIYFVLRESAGAFLYRRPLDTGQQTRVAQLPELANVSIDLSADGRYLLYTAMPPLASDIMLAVWED